MGRSNLPSWEISAPLCRDAPNTPLSLPSLGREGVPRGLGLSLTNQPPSFGRKARSPCPAVSWSPGRLLLLCHLPGCCLSVQKLNPSAADLGTQGGAPFLALWLRPFIGLLAQGLTAGSQKSGGGGGWGRSRARGSQFRQPQSWASRWNWTLPRAGRTDRPRDGS